MVLGKGTGVHTVIWQSWEPQVGVEEGPWCLISQTCCAPQRGAQACSGASPQLGCMRPGHPLPQRPRGICCLCQLCEAAKPCFLPRFASVGAVLVPESGQAWGSRVQGVLLICHQTPPPHLLNRARGPPSLPSSLHFFPELHVHCPNPQGCWEATNSTGQRPPEAGGTPALCDPTPRSLMLHSCPHLACSPCRPQPRAPAPPALGQL